MGGHLDTRGGNPRLGEYDRPNPKWMVEEMFGGTVPKEIILPKPKFLITDIQEPTVRNLEIKPEEFTPPDQVRKWVGEFPTDLKIDPAALLGPQ